MLSGRKRRTVRELKKFDNGRFFRALTKLLPFAGLWCGLKLGSLNRALPMHCREVCMHGEVDSSLRLTQRQELYSYLESIRRIWNRILGSDVQPHCLDVKTVEMFHLLMPAYSSHDAHKIRTAMRNLDAFPHVRNAAIRRNVEIRTLSCERVLTIESFLADVMYLEGRQHARR